MFYLFCSFSAAAAPVQLIFITALLLLHMKKDKTNKHAWEGRNWDFGMSFGEFLRVGL